MSRRRLSLLIATMGGVGYIPVAPGTCGSIAALGLAWVALDVTAWPAWALGVAALLLAPLASWACDQVERNLNTADPGFIVIDEMVGQWLTLAAIRPERPLDWLGALALFRVFDVLKPWPIRRLEKIPNGWGVVADDLAAGACAMMTIAVIRAWNGG